MGAEGVVIGAGEVAAEVFFGRTAGEIAEEEALNGGWHFVGGGAVSQGTGGAGVLAYGSADAEVEGVDEDSVLLDFLALEADVGDPVLAAGVGAAGDVEADLLVEAGEAVFQFIDEPFVEALGFCDG